MFPSPPAPPPATPVPSLPSPAGSTPPPLYQPSSDRSKVSQKTCPGGAFKDRLLPMLIPLLAPPPSPHAVNTKPRRRPPSSPPLPLTGGPRIALPQLPPPPALPSTDHSPFTSTAETRWLPLSQRLKGVLCSYSCGARC